MLGIGMGWYQFLLFGFIPFSVFLTARSTYSYWQYAMVDRSYYDAFGIRASIVFIFSSQCLSIALACIALYCMSKFKPKTHVAVVVLFSYKLCFSLGPVLLSLPDYLDDSYGYFFLIIQLSFSTCYVISIVYFLKCRILFAPPTDGEAVNIGLRHCNHANTASDIREAKHWFNEAAEQGNAFAMTLLGEMCIREDLLGAGSASEQAKQLAASWYEKAAELGEVHAMANLSFFCRVGIGVDQDEEKADYWKEKAIGLKDSYLSGSTDKIGTAMVLFAQGDFNFTV
ncbi:MAG: sel1 repeat family protein [Clostridiales bacterium]|nr:sel1 repeat family protein [Clostridiales bacterium]